MLDFIVIGQGLAGSCVSHFLLQENQKIQVIDQPSKNNCSSVAAGIINPITGMRLTKTWLAETIFPYAKDFYQRLEKEAETTFWHSKEIIRPANDIEQLNDALSRISDNFLGDYITYEPNNKELDNSIHANLGYYKINSGGYLDVTNFLAFTKNKLIKSNAYSEEWVEEKDIKYTDDYIEVNGVKAKNIIFCSGHYQQDQGLFSYLPFSSTVGEMIKLKTATINPSYVYSKSSFLVSKTPNEFIAGATFSRDLSKTLTKEGKEFVKEKMENLIQSDFEITHHYYGIRPTNRDRKPFVGKHPKQANCYVLNGLGAKGVTQAPYFANQLTNHILQENRITEEADINRCTKRFFND